MASHRLSCFVSSVAILAAALCSSAATAGAIVVPAPQHVSFGGHIASPEAQQIADWTMATGDNQDLPFLIVDKIAARMFLFDRRGTLQAATSVLLGSARGDVSPPGVGDKKLALITPAERITPAGRFVADKGTNLAGRDIVWVDYAAAIAIHRATDLTPGTTAQDRLKRLASGSPRDRRISLGCINVSETFYDTFLRPAFAASSGVVYILPETATSAAIFAQAATDAPKQS